MEIRIVKHSRYINGKINRKDWGLNWNAALETGTVAGIEKMVNLNSLVKE
jgi:polyisoprenoid-binding protein YceI